MTVMFTDGKGVAFRGPYTVATFCPPRWRPLLEHLLQRRSRPDEPLFPASLGTHAARQRAMLEALRSARAGLNLRAMRRGSLQHLASAGVDVPTLMHFSGHTVVTTLLRYLGYGRLSATTMGQGHAAARLLSSAA